MHEGARIDLFPEEEYDRVTPRLDVCAVLAATGFPVEFLTLNCIPAMFSGFGKVLEIDPLVLSGRELATVRAVVLLKNPRRVPCDVWPLGGGGAVGHAHCRGASRARDKTQKKTEQLE